MQMEGLSVAEQLELNQRINTNLHSCKAYGQERQQERFEVLAKRDTSTVVLSTDTHTMNELRQQLRDARAASNAAQKEQEQKEFRVMQLDSDLADLKQQLESEKAARATAFTRMEEAYQRQAASTQQSRIEKHTMRAEVEGLKQQLAAAARQQHLLRHELRSAQQQSMTASAGNVALKAQIQATQQALAAATGGTDDAKAERMWSLNNYSIAFRDAVQKANEKKFLAEAKLAELQSSSGTNIQQLKSELLKLQRTIDRMPKRKQEGKSAPTATAKQHRGHSAAASGHSSTAETAPALAAASKAQMGPGRKVATTQAGGSRQQGMVSLATPPTPPAAIAHMTVSAKHHLTCVVCTQHVQRKAIKHVIRSQQPP